MTKTLCKACHFGSEKGSKMECAAFVSGIVPWIDAKVIPCERVNMSECRFTPKGKEPPAGRFDKTKEKIAIEKEKPITMAELIGRGLA